MRRLVLLLAVLWAAVSFAQTQPTASQSQDAKLRIGDTIGVTVIGYQDYSGEYVVSDDGNLTGVGFGTVPAADKTVAELKTEIVGQFKKIFNDPRVDVVLRKQSGQFIYMIGSQHTEPILYKPGMDLRQVIGMAGLPDAPSVFDCKVSRSGGPVRTVNLVKLLKGDADEWDGPMQPNDVVSLISKVFHVSVTGEVNMPGEYMVDDDSQLESAIAQAKGITKDGTLQNVLVFRGKDVFQVDASASALGKKQPFALQPNDSIVVRKSENAVYVLGEVRMPGRYVIPDNKTVTVADALAAAQGLAPSGSLRRVSVVKADQTGKVVATPINLDEFLKKGKMQSNPTLGPGDIVYFGQPNAVQLISIQQIASTAFLLKGIIP